MRAGFLLILSTVLLWSTSFHLSSSERNGAYLQATIAFTPQNTPENNQEKILPGNPINLKAKIKNIGNKASSAGKIFIRFAFLEPLHSHQKSLLFKTESKDLPPIPPGKEIEINFQTDQRWPSFFDYIREDWPMRQFEAIVVFNGQEQIIGRIAVSISANYYQGPLEEKPKQVPSNY